MVQKEFGERLAAPAGTRQSSALSVQLQLIAFTSIAFYVPPTAFVPAPKVDSCIIIIEPRRDVSYEVKFLRAFRIVVRALFGQRRKMARRALKSLDVDPHTLLSVAKMDGSRRGETFNLDELSTLAQSYLSIKEA